MKSTVAAVLLCILGASTASAADAGDAACVAGLTAGAKRARRLVTLYTSELKNMTGNPYAQGSMSVCSGALSRADQFYAKQTAGKSVCTGGSNYVDNQVAHLYKTATSTCRNELDTQVQRLPTDEQSQTDARVAGKEAQIR